MINGIQRIFPVKQYSVYSVLYGLERIFLSSRILLILLILSNPCHALFR